MARKINVSFDGVMYRLEELERENRRLRAENAAMRPIVAAVAMHGMYTPFYPPDGPVMYGCDWCHAKARKLDAIKHGDGCEYKQARTFVAAHPTTGEGE